MTPEILIYRKANEFDDNETYYSLFSEGRYQGEHQHQFYFRNPNGLDYNRNFPTDWAPEHKQVGAGDYPLSNPETRAIAEAVVARKNIIAAQDFHTFSAVILRPSFNTPDDSIPDEDLFIYKALGEIGSKLTGYPCVGVHEGFKVNKNSSLHGAFIDWLYADRGIYVFTNEIWNIFKRAGIKIEDTKHLEFLFSQLDESQQERLLKWCDEHCEPGFFKEWQEMEHPDLGTVEIGGWKVLDSVWNPPTKFLAEEVDKNAEFVLAMIESNPRLVVNKVDTHKLSEKLTSVKFEIQNIGYLPTGGTKAAGEVRHVTQAYRRVKLSEGQKLISGETYKKVDPLLGRSRTSFLTSQFWSYYKEQPDNTAIFEWVIEGSGPVEFEFNYVRGGCLRHQLEL